MASSKKVKGRTNIDADAMVAAIKQVKIDHKPLRAAARQYGIPPATLHLNIQKVDAKISDISATPDACILDVVRENGDRHLTILTVQQEKALLEYIVKCSKHYYGLNVTEVRELAYQFARKVNAEYPASWNEDSMAGMKWYRLFMKRHKTLLLRTLEQTSLNRVKSFCTSNVNVFFSQLDEVTTATHFSADNIWNMDETGFSTGPTKFGEVILLKCERRVGQIYSAERGSMVTMALAVNAAGSSIAPFFLFPGKKMQAAFMDNAPDGAIGYSNESGCMKQTEFIKWMQHFIAKSHSSKMAPVLLLLDNHTLHLSVEALDLAGENGVTLLSFPPHCSHRIQPLDVSVYGSMKTFYKIECTKWQKNNAGKVLEIRHIVDLVSSTLDLALTRTNIKAGFAATGIHPYNNTILSESDFVMTEFNLEQEAAAEVEKNADENQQLRIVVGETVPLATAMASTSDTSSVAASLSPLVAEVGSLKATTPLKSAVLTSPQFLSEPKKKRRKCDEAQKNNEEKAKKSPTKAPKPAAKSSKRAAITADAKTPAKRDKKKQSPDSSDEDVDFCIICLEDMPRKLTNKNSIKCNSCQRAVHFKCANMHASYFTCNKFNSNHEEKDAEDIED